MLLQANERYDNGFEIIYKRSTDRTLKDRRRIIKFLLRTNDSKSKKLSWYIRIYKEKNGKEPEY